MKYKRRRTREEEEEEISESRGPSQSSFSYEQDANLGTRLRKVPQSKNRRNKSFVDASLSLTDRHGNEKFDIIGQLYAYGDITPPVNERTQSRIWNFDLSENDQHNIAPSKVFGKASNLYMKLQPGYDLKEITNRVKKMFPCWPFIEYERSRRIEQLRKQYENDCMELICGLKAPAESFNRWLLEQLSVSLIDLIPNTTNEGKSSNPIPLIDPILKKPEVCLTSSVIKHEIMSDIPCRIRHRNPFQALSNIRKYCETGTEWMKKLIENPLPGTDSYLTEDESKKIMNSLKIDIIEIETNLQNRFSSEDIKPGQMDMPFLMKQIDKIKKQISPLFKKLIEPRAIQVCERLVQNSKLMIKELNELKYQMFNYEQSTAKDQNPYHVVVTLLNRNTLQKKSTKQVESENQMNEKFNICFVELYKLEKTDGEQESWTLLDTIRIKMLYFNKLRSLYFSNPDNEKSKFENHLYVLLRRYQSMFGPEDGGNFHAALPEIVFEWLNKNLKASRELFASPLNCYFKNYCSAFLDIDCYFGSSGSFFDFKPISGSFECCPPYSLEVMDACAKYCIKLLDECNNEHPLSFVIIVPEWIDTDYGTLLSPKNCKYCVYDCIVEAMNHKFIMGLQHLADQRRYWTLPIQTHVYFLQNEKATQTWPITKDIKASFHKIIRGDTNALKAEEKTVTPEKYNHSYYIMEEPGDAEDMDFEELATTSFTSSDFSL